LEIPVQSPEIIDIPVTVPITEEEVDVITVPLETIVTPPKIEKPVTPGTTVSALSLSSIRAKKELQQSQKAVVRDVTQLPTEPFTETDMLLQWNKYAQRLGDKGRKIMESLMLVNDPKLKGTTIYHELPNEGSKIDFEGEKLDLLGYLRGKLHNHDITIELIVNEEMDSRRAFTPQDRYNRLNEINPNLDLLRRTFDLDI
jgi:hypothetical protein